MTKRMIPELNTTAFKADELAWLKKVAGLVEEVSTADVNCAKQ